MKHYAQLYRRPTVGLPNNYNSYQKKFSPISPDTRLSMRGHRPTGVHVASPAPVPWPLVLVASHSTGSCRMQPRHRYRHHVCHSNCRHSCVNHLGHPGHVARATGGMTGRPTTVRAVRSGALVAHVAVNIFRADSVLGHVSREMGISSHYN